MSKWDKPYRVFDTPCFPARWKVGRFEDDSNNTVNYFRDYHSAQRECDRRNTTLTKEPPHDQAVQSSSISLP